ncbi:motile sperm domain-containing protein 2-like [Plodia interpunctella]|uniref:motile sperm domain-containing protein 2-like n=1 Tax=Plodia interpunctella TaxID=58824 RepID=UPI0023688272|nr:motile sperm domain-containing protein 2-like [Plodia interpunctella]
MATPDDLRSAFEKRMKQGIPNPPGEFDPQDLELIKDDKYLNKVLDHQDRDLKKASNMLWEIMLWRKTVGANQINESNIRLDYLKEGVFFPRGRDKDGGVLLIIKNKLHVRGQKDFNDIKRILIYWLERIDREENHVGKITLFFDMEGCGMGNVDMELIKFLISLFETFYPNFMNYIVIYQMPWILNAVFKIVKTLLPAKGIDILKSLNRDNLKTIVPPDQALTCWGGNDPYVFEFVPENTTDNRKVTFSDDDDTHSPGEMLRLNPHDTVIFKNVNDDLTGQFTITNMDDNAVSFKIRTTSPEKFRVRPSSGLLASGAVQTVQILVQPSVQQNTGSKDRFLVMSIQLPKPDLTATEMADIWQNSSDSKVDEYRLKCQFPQMVTSNGSISNGIAKQVSITNSLQSNYDALRRDIARLQKFQYATLFLSSIAMILTYLIYNTDSDGERCDYVHSVDF